MEQLKHSDYERARDTALALHPIAASGDPEAARVLELLVAAMGAPMDNEWAGVLMLEMIRQGERIMGES